MQVAYQPEEDRLLCRTSFRTADGELQEVRAWLTRRLVTKLWSGILDALASQVALEKPQAAHATPEILNMEHQASVEGMRESGGFSRPFDDAIAAFPLGEAPLLPVAVEFTVHPQQPVRINFVTGGEAGFELALSSALLHTFCSMLKDAVRPAGWDLQLDLPAAAAPAGRVLN